jgi:hypothetical protein
MSAVAGFKYDSLLWIPEFGSGKAWCAWREVGIDRTALCPLTVTVHSADHPETLDRYVLAGVAKGYGASVCEQEEEL